MSSPAQVRDLLVERLTRDLVGPQDLAKPDEILADYPTDKYLTGIIYPLESRVPQEEDEDMSAGDGDGDADDAAVPLVNCRRPASAGLSFMVSGPATVMFTVRGARYVRRWLAGDGKTLEDAPKSPDRKRLRWLRTEPAAASIPVVFGAGIPDPVDLGAHGFPGLQLFLQAAAAGPQLAITGVLVNRQKGGDRRDTAEERAWFQTSLEATVKAPAVLSGRPVRRAGSTKDDFAAELIYREAVEYAVGHTCAASWSLDERGSVTAVRTNWIPASVVHPVSFDGDEVFAAVRADGKLRPFSAAWLAAASCPEITAALSLVPEAYERWIAGERARIPGLPARLQSFARTHEELWKRGASRMRAAISRLESDDSLFRSFKLANRAMARQRLWARPDEKDLSWRPFQIAFILLVLESAVDNGHSDRDVMDLLWFPTGGGKTEAYLGVIAMVLFHRRLAARGMPEGAGVSVLMRYTLRVLTTQQFDRAAKLVLACEEIRMSGEKGLGSEPFSIGLWVGSTAIPNRVADAHSDPEQRAFQVKECPACRERLVLDRDHSAYQVCCINARCGFGAARRPLPLWTVDQDIYARLPSLLIGTVDKFAQVARKEETGRLFGIGTPHRPPDLIIQDELHLISGPLGTLTGLYETAIDAFCSRDDGPRPKVIGSTATIRMAERQVRDLFNRSLFQFPPPGLDAGNSCFAVTENDPGRARLYLGVTTAGRSAKFTLQSVAASLLQATGSAAVPLAEQDAYWTLVTYFNSLRELGGAHVLFLDDVPKSMAEYAGRRAELAARGNLELAELTSRLSQAEIPGVLAQLGKKKPERGVLDVLLSTNMISVGVDIPRLALMVVNGQPKGIAEYIQATSRVGRDRAPGLVLTVFNGGKPRDRSHFETFTTWHATLYRDVEPTSVTPFAARALDKALRGVLVALTRHLVPSMARNPVLDASNRADVERMAAIIIDRAQAIDPDERAEVERKLMVALDEWEKRENLSEYWDEKNPGRSLVISAERRAALKAVNNPRANTWAAPNSMRDVEPGTTFRLLD